MEGQSARQVIQLASFEVRSRVGAAAHAAGLEKTIGEQRTGFLEGFRDITVTALCTEGSCGAEVLRQVIPDGGTVYRCTGCTKAS